MTADEPILVVQDLRKRFAEKEILRGISLQLHRGDIKVLIGPSGAGKSTLLHCINLLLPADDGRILLHGRDVTGFRKRRVYEYRQKVGMIFQDFNLFDHLTALRNVMIGLVRVKKIPKNEARRRALRELERVGLAEHADQYPAELSGGQKQRVSIARALAMEPEVMLLDEPTSSLDPELTGEVLTVIQDLAAAGMTMMMATHQFDFAESLANEIIFMEDGAIVEKGTPQKMLYAAENLRTREFCARIHGYWENPER